MKHLVLSIQGMSCSHCLNAVNRALRAQPGVEIESVRIGRAEIRFDENQADPTRIATAIADAGYVVVDMIQ